MQEQQMQAGVPVGTPVSGVEEDNILQVFLGYFRTFVRPYFWMYPVAVILFLAGAFVFLRTAVPQYSSSAEVLVNRQEVRALSVEGLDDPTLLGSRESEFIKTQERVLKSDEILSKAYERLGSDSGVVSAPSVSQIPGLQILTVTVTSSKPEAAAKFANIIVDEYLSFTNRRKMVINRAGSEVLREQLKQVQEDRRRAMDELLEFKAKHDIFDFDKNYADQVSLKSELMSKYHVAKLDEEELGATIQEVRDHKGDAIVMLPYLVPNESSENVTQFQRMLLEHEMKKPELLTQYNESHLVIKVHNIVTAMIKKAANDQLEVLLRGMELRRQRLVKRQKQLLGQVSQIEKKLGELDRLGGDYRMRETVCSKLDETITMITNRLNELQIAESTTLGDYSVCKMNDAKVATVPYFPKPVMVIGLAAACGLAFALLISIVLVLLNNKVNDIGDAVQILGGDVTVLGSVPHFSEKEGQLLKSDGEDSIDEVFRDIRTSMHLSMQTRESKIFAVSSSLVSEGKTFTTTNLARSFARDKKRVLLMDLDMRKPRIHQILKEFIPEELRGKGLSNVLVGDCKLEDVIVHVDALGMDVALAGPLPPNPNELIGSAAFEKLVTDVKSTYDYTFIDTPPMMLVSDTLLIASYSIPLLLVARLRRLPKPALMHLHQRLTQLKLHLAGLIANQGDSSDSNPSYRYGAYYGGSYGGKYGYKYSNRQSKKKR